MRDLFLIDPKVTYLNHGSYGACPKSVFLDYQNFQKRLEEQPAVLQVFFENFDNQGILTLDKLHKNRD